MRCCLLLWSIKMLSRWAGRCSRSILESGSADFGIGMSKIRVPVIIVPSLMFLAATCTTAPQENCVQLRSGLYRAAPDSGQTGCVEEFELPEPYEGYPEWGPNDWIIFTHTPLTEDGDRNIAAQGYYIMRPDGSGKKRFIENAAPYYNLRWSPDGKWLAGSYDARQIIKISFPGKEIITLTDPSDFATVHPSWSPDGQTIAYILRNDDPKEMRGIWTVAADGQQPPRQLWHSFPAPAYTSWSPDGQQIATVTFRNYHGNNELSLLDVETQTVEQIAYREEGIREPHFSPDGERILFQTRPTEHSDGQIWVVDREGSGLKQLTERGGRWPDWSPDGRYIVYVRWSYLRPDQPGNGHLWMMRADGSKKEQLIH